MGFGSNHSDTAAMTTIGILLDGLREKRAPAFLDGVIGWEIITCCYCPAEVKKRFGGSSGVEVCDFRKSWPLSSVYSGRVLA